MQTSDFLAWVKDWFYHPGSINQPQQDRISVFQAVVMMTGYQPTSESSRTLHDMMTYMLLGWHKVTAWIKTSEFDPPDNPEEVAGWESCKETMRSLLDFDVGYVSNIYPLLICLDAKCKDNSVMNLSRFTGERLYMLVLALSLIDRKMTRQLDLSSIRACLDLLYRSRTLAVKAVEHEYASTSHDLFYFSWIHNQINRLLMLHVPTDEFRSTVSYLGWFVSLIRAYRTIAASHRNESWVVEFNKMLDNEEKLLRDAIDSSSLNCHPDRVRDGPDVCSTSRLFSAFRIKPPPVKIRFAKTS